MPPKSVTAYAKTLTIAVDVKPDSSTEVSIIPQCLFKLSSCEIAFSTKLQAAALDGKIHVLGIVSGQGTNALEKTCYPNLPLRVILQNASKRSVSCQVLLHGKAVDVDMTEWPVTTCIC